MDRIMKFKITQSTKRTDHRNPISGHQWSVHHPVQRWEVSNGILTETRNTEAAARRLCDRYNAMEDRFPFTMPRSERELAKAERLGLKVGE